MTKSVRISRRTVLKGLGAAIALPWLEAMMPSSLGATAAKAPPRRLAFFYVPNGVNMEDWTPKTVGDNFALPQILEPLNPFKQELLVLTGLTCDKARPNGDGPGDHARAMASFLTGRQARKTHGADIRVGISADQVAALKVGNQTRFPSLELGCDKGLNSGNCDSGYSCAYSANISWRSEALPMAKEINPRLVFERLFAGHIKDEADQNRARRERYQASILDFVKEDADRLRSKLGATDQRKMDEYLDSVREIERRIVRGTKPSADDKDAPTMARPAGVPREYQDHMRLLGDLMVLAFQGDLTRVSTFVFANEGSNRSYKFIGVPEGHHDLSHHGRNKAKMEKIRTINRFHMAQFAYILDKLKAVREGNGTLLDQCMILYGSGNSDGDRHNHDDLPILVVGKGGGTLKTGRHVRYTKDTPLTNLYLGLLDRMGVPTPALGDSTGKLESLS